MVRPKVSSKKQQKRGVDFKKIKRKIGRKLPPANNATNTEIKSKAIILPEQSVASEKAGMAVSKKGLTLKDLLQQTSHHNAKVRRDALSGIKDICLRYPEEFRQHKYAAVEKLRERISDDDKVVRETLHLLLKSVILPSLKEEDKRPLVSLIMGYIFNAMTNLAIDVRLMAFRFFDLIVQYYPPSVSLYAEKMLQNYEGILQKNHSYIHDKGKLKIVLAGLVNCLSLFPRDKRKVISHENHVAGETILHAFELDVPTELKGFSVVIKKMKDLVPLLTNCFQDFIPLVHNASSLDTQSFECMLWILQSIDHAVSFFVYGMHMDKQGPEPSHGGNDMIMWGQSISSVLLNKLLVLFPLNPINHFSEKDDDRYFTLNIVISEILLHLTKWICLPAFLMEHFFNFIEFAMGKINSRPRSGRAVQEKHLISLLTFFPKLIISEEACKWKSRLLEAFTDMFKNCSPESKLKLACLSTFEDMLIYKQDKPHHNANDSELVDFQRSWIRELPLLLIQLGDKHAASTQAVLHLQLRLGQCGLSNSLLEDEYNNMQYTLSDFFCLSSDEENVKSGPFFGLPRDSQELALCCLYYFSFLDSVFLKSIFSCCICQNLDPFVLHRILEILHSSYKAGHIQIGDHISFFVTLLSRFRVLPENIYPVRESNVEISNRETLKSVNRVVCSYLLQMGDSSLLFGLLEKVIVDQISLRLPLDNACAMLRMLVTLDSKPTRLSEQSILCLCNFLPAYLTDVLHCIPEDADETTASICIRARRYYLLPCFYLFDRSHELLNLVLNGMGSLITQSSSTYLSSNFARSTSDHPSRINAIVSVLILMQKDVKLQPVVSSLKVEIGRILSNISLVQSSKEIDLTIQEKNKIQCAVDRLKIVTSTLPGTPMI